MPPEDCLASLFEVQASEDKDVPIADPSFILGTFQAIEKTVNDSLRDQERSSLMSFLASYQELFDFNVRILT